MTNEKCIHVLQCIEYVGLNTTKMSEMSESTLDHSDMANNAIIMAIKGLEFINENCPETFKDYLNGYKIKE